MFRKRGQLTTFIFIGVVLVMIAAIIFYAGYQEQRVKEVYVFPLEVESVKNYVTQCLNDVSENAIFLLGMKGGYTDFPQDVKSTETFFTPVALWYDAGNGLAPTDDEIKSEISKYVNIAIRNCVDISSLKLNVSESGAISSSATIKNDSVIVDLIYPLDIKIGDSVTHIEEFSSTVSVRLGGVLDSARKIEGMQEELKGEFDYGFIRDEILQDVTFYNYDGVYITSILDDSSFIFGTPYMFRFASVLE